MHPGLRSTLYLPSRASPTEALSRATAHASSGRVDNVTQAKSDRVDFVDVGDNPYVPGAPGTKYSYV